MLSLNKVVHRSMIDLSILLVWKTRYDVKLLLRHQKYVGLFSSTKKIEPCIISGEVGEYFSVFLVFPCHAKQRRIYQNIDTQNLHLGNFFRMYSNVISHYNVSRRSVVGFSDPTQKFLHIFCAKWYVYVSFITTKIMSVISCRDARSIIDLSCLFYT